MIDYFDISISTALVYAENLVYKVINDITYLERITLKTRNKLNILNAKKIVPSYIIIEFKNVYSTISNISKSNISKSNNLINPKVYKSLKLNLIIITEWYLNEYININLYKIENYNETIDNTIKPKDILGVVGILNSQKELFNSSIKEKVLEKESEIRLIENDIFLKRENIVKSYIENPNNILIFDYVNDLLSHFENTLNSYPSKELMKFKLHYCYMLINTGILEKIQIAKNILEDILKITVESLDKDFELPNIYEKTMWLYSITHRLSKNSNKAFDICEKSIKTLKGLNRETLILNRELFVISKDIKYINEIQKENLISKYNIIEEFNIKRRLFEYYLSQKDAIKAKELFYTTKSFLNIIQNRLDKIYIYMFYKDTYFYFKLTNNSNSAKIYYEKALNGFINYGFFGQLEKLENSILYA
ncbi:MAG: hypothetical protein ABF289_09820 [Clostridiales bacterium]